MDFFLTHWRDITKTPGWYAFFAVTLMLPLVVTSGALGQQQPKYAANVPEFVLTPDKIPTQLLGDLVFVDGLPDESTVQKLYDFLDVSRGAEAFLLGIPASSVYAVLEGFKEAGMNTGDIGIFEDLMDARSLFLTTQFDHPIRDAGSRCQGWTCGP